MEEQPRHGWPRIFMVSRRRFTELGRRLHPLPFHQAKELQLARSSARYASSMLVIRHLLPGELGPLQGGASWIEERATEPTRLGLPLDNDGAHPLFVARVFRFTLEVCDPSARHTHPLGYKPTHNTKQT